MHRALPEHPSLEYLKKEAKDLLGTLRQQRLDAQLADAQYALARQYGFASWPRLKQHVEDAAPAVVTRPFAGTWIANVEKSKPHPSQPFQSLTLQLSLRHDVLTITQWLVDPSGQEQRHRTALHVDGCEHGADDRPGLTAVANWRGSHALDVVVRKDGEVVSMGAYEVSRDGTVLELKTAAGDAHIVLERSEAGGRHV